MNQGIFDLLLRIVLPPVLGAAIGYITNALAIRMLFRPLTEKRLLGIRIPLTPGIIPKQRHALAVNIGRMVSQELITVDSLQSHIETKGFQEGISNNVSLMTTNILETPLESLKVGDLEVVYGSLDGLLAETLKGFLGSRNFIHAVRSIISRLVGSLSNKPLGTLLENVDLQRFLDSRVLPFLKNGTAGKLLRSGVGNWIKKHLKENTPLEKLVPESAVDAVTELLRSLLPSLLDSLMDWLKKKETRRQMEAKGRILLKDVLDKLGSVQKFFVSVGQYDKTLDEKMPEIVDEVLKKIKELSSDEMNRNQIVLVIRKAINNWRKKGIFDAAYSGGVNLEEKIGTLMESVSIYLEGEDFAGRLAELMERYVAANEDRTLGELLSRFLGMQEMDIVEMASTPVLRFLTRDETSEAASKEIISLTQSFLADRGETRIGELLKINTERKSRLDIFLTQKLFNIIVKRLPSLVQSFDVQQMVEEKIDGLDVAQVEKLLLIVIAKHLKWINIFGAFLGGLIGFFQVILNLLQRI